MAVIVSRLVPVSITPFGRPVVPPVPTIMARSSTAARSICSVGSSPRNSSHDRAPSAGGPSRQTTVVSFGSSPRICATSGAKDCWWISTVQSKRSSSSRFSAASLRGLIGHHTAPARLIPKTQVNATGSLADRIATLSPGATPWRSRAVAIRKLSSRTSAYDELIPSVVRQGAPGSTEAPLSR